MEKKVKQIQTLPPTQERLERKLMVEEMLKEDGYRYAVFRHSFSGKKMSFVVAYKTKKEAEDQAVKLLADQLTRSDRTAFSVVKIEKTFIFDNGFKELLWINIK